MKLNDDNEIDMEYGTACSVEQRNIEKQPEKKCCLKSY